MNASHFYTMVPRYSRAEHGMMIHYGGEGRPAQIDLFHMKRFMDVAAAWTKLIGATPAFGAKLCEDKMLMLLISAQATEIMRLWHDVRRLDTLRDLEDKAENLEDIEYHTRITQQCLDGDKCTCGVCVPSEENLKQMRYRVKKFKKLLPASVFQRVFSELDMQ
ncbi:hypothetical protein EXIGLDRAFT_759322 [Exidia glandulosa HHB12029]|uniref:Uncharacterized protein n=1 Tax=Exidia glandulosa HHB12029 TaxID=1314781 RepID=A0A165Q2W7_EXIGL|nr:hypothetical protein EXIGLDRAFT_759322 [Exidia glandulosa HHB12029]